MHLRLDTIPGIRKYLSRSSSTKISFGIRTKTPETIWTVSFLEQRSIGYVDIPLYGFPACIFGQLLEHDHMNDSGGDLDPATYCGGSYTDLYIHQYTICTLKYM